MVTLLHARTQHKRRYKPSIQRQLWVKYAPFRNDLVGVTGKPYAFHSSMIWHLFICSPRFVIKKFYFSLSFTSLFISPLYSFYWNRFSIHVCIRNPTFIDITKEMGTSSEYTVISYMSSQSLPNWQMLTPFPLNVQRDIPRQFLIFRVWTEPVASIPWRGWRPR